LITYFDRANFLVAYCKAPGSGQPSHVRHCRVLPYTFRSNRNTRWSHSARLTISRAAAHTSRSKIMRQSKGRLPLESSACGAPVGLGKSGRTGGVVRHSKADAPLNQTNVVAPRCNPVRSANSEKFSSAQFPCWPSSVAEPPSLKAESLHSPSTSRTRARRSP
jgi:hypothetical protein